MKKDTYLWGGFIGLIIPVILFVIIYFLTNQASPDGSAWLENQKLIMLSVIPNVILIRYFLVSLKADKAGRGMLFSTLILIILALFLPLIEKSLF